MDRELPWDGLRFCFPLFHGRLERLFMVRSGGGVKRISMVRSEGGVKRISNG